MVDHSDSMALRPLVTDAASGVLLFGITPPRLSTPPERIREITAATLARLDFLDVDGLALYDIDDESDRNPEERPFPYLPTMDPAGYHAEIEKRLGADSVGADLILEVFVPRNELISFLEEARRVLLVTELPLVYGTVRFIEQDKDTFLAWAKKRFACVIFSLHTSGETQALRKTGDVCKQLIRAATKRGGSFYLTYNRFATRDELSSAYPQFQDFLSLKKRYDPRETFQSDWYRYYKGVYA